MCYRSLLLKNSATGAVLVATNLQNHEGEKDMEPKTTTNKPTGAEANITGNKPETSSTPSTTSTRTTPATSSTPGSSTLGSSTSSNPTSGSSTTSSSGYGAGTAAQQSRDRYNEASATYREAEGRVSEAVNQASQVASDAWNRASNTVSNTYEHTLDYGRDNPGRVILVAFGAGVAVGLLLANSAPSRSRGRRIVPPVINALSEIAREFFD